MEGEYEQHGNIFCPRVGTSHTLLRTTKLAMNDTIMVSSGKIALTQQSTSMVERFLLVDDDGGPMWQPTTSDLVVSRCKIK
jgi:hypothetical protein